LKVIYDSYSGWRMIATCVRQLRYSEVVPWEKEFRAYGRVNGYGVLIAPEKKPVCPEIGITATDKEAAERIKCLENLEAWNRKQGRNITSKEANEWGHPLQENPSDEYPRGMSEREKAGEMIEFDEDDPELIETENGLSILRIVMLVLGMAADSIGIYVNSRSNYYWYNFGKNTSGLPMKLFILLDYVFFWNIIMPTDPWVAYRYEREEVLPVCPVCPTTVTPPVEITDGTSQVGDGRLPSDRNPLISDSFFHIDKDISCEQKRARAISLGCREKGTRRHGRNDRRREAATRLADIDASLDF